MKKISTLTVVLALAITANAQIPNSGFENWGTHNGNESPNGWTGAGGITTGYSIQKNADNYPSGNGSYSILIKSDMANGVMGLARTGNQSQLAPAFAITGHPTRLKGYYKFLPLNGDTMNISVVLFQGGTVVAGGIFRVDTTVANWTSFYVQIPSYTMADSAFIFLASCNSNGGAPVPHGNSALYVDNLSLDTLVTMGISEENELSGMAVYPNPTSGQFTVSLPTDYGTITITNMLGQQLLHTQATQKNMNLQLDNSGIYLVCVKTNEGTTTQKVVVSR